MFVAQLLPLLLSSGLVAARRETVLLERHGIPIEFTLDSQRPLDGKSLERGLRSHGLTGADLRSLNLESVQSKEVLASLPSNFFDMLTAEQVQQMARNPALVDLLTGRYQPRIQGWTDSANQVKHKLAALHRHLETVTPETVGEEHFDALMKRMDTKLYRHLDPIAALRSKHFERSIGGFAGLFGLSRRKLLRQLALPDGKRARKKHLKAMSRGRSKFISEMQEYIRQFVEAAQQDLLQVTAAIAFQMLERGVPVPSFMMSRLTRIVAQITAKAAEQRLLMVKTGVAEVLAQADAKAAEEAATAEQPCRITSGVPRVLGKVLATAESLRELADSLRKRMSAASSPEDAQELLISIASLSSMSYAANGLILSKDILRQAALTCPPLLREIVKAEESITHDFATIAKIAKGIQTAYTRDGEERAEIEANTALMRSGLRRIRLLADKLYADITAISERIMAVSSDLAGLTRGEKRRLLFKQTVTATSTKKKAKLPRLGRRRNPRSAIVDAVPKHPVSADTEIEYDEAQEAEVPVISAPLPSSSHRQGLADALFNIANHWTQLVPFRGRH